MSSFSRNAQLNASSTPRYRPDTPTMADRLDRALKSAAVGVASLQALLDDAEGRAQLPIHSEHVINAARQAAVQLFDDIYFLAAVPAEVLKTLAPGADDEVKECEVRQ